VLDALRLVFTKFTELQSVRQVHMWLRDEGITLPVACHRAAEGRSIALRLPLYNHNGPYVTPAGANRIRSRFSRPGQRRRPPHPLRPRFFPSRRRAHTRAADLLSC
jgi:hypothetical protein